MFNSDEGENKILGVAFQSLQHTPQRLQPQFQSQQLPESQFQQQQLSQQQLQQQGNSLSLQQKNEINAVDNTKVKLPDFVEEYAELWFWQVEAAFEAARVLSDRKKYNTIIGQLPTRVMYKLADLRTKPPQDGRMYETLKQRIMEEFADTTQAKITQLLEAMSLGDRKPSQLLAEMRAKAAHTPVTDALLKELWTRNLPEQVRAIVSSNDLTLNQASTMADRVAEALKPYRSVNALSSTSSIVQEDTSYTIQQIQRQIDQIFQQLKGNQRGYEQRFRSSDRYSNGRDRTPSRLNNGANGFQVQRNPTYEFCWWHYKFGKDARKCKQPCSFKQSDFNDRQKSVSKN